MERRAKTLLVTMLLGINAVAQAASEPPRVEIIKMEDRRVARQVTGKQDLFWENVLTFETKVSLPGSRLRMIGGMKLEAKDDKGRVLALKDFPMPPLEGKPFRTVQPSTEPGQLQPDAAKLTFAITSPERSARTVSLRGEVVLLVEGEEQEVKISEIKKLVGKGILDDASLKAAGLELSPVEPSGMAATLFVPADMHRVLVMEVSGQADQLSSAELIDNGKTVKATTGSINGVTTLLFDSPRPLSDSASLRLVLSFGATRVKAPIDLIDVALP